MDKLTKYATMIGNGLVKMVFLNLACEKSDNEVTEKSSQVQSWLLTSSHRYRFIIEDCPLSSFKKSFNSFWED